MTILQRIEAVKNTELRGKLLANLVYGNRGKEADTDAEALLRAFTWEDTPEGNTYWDRLYSNLFVGDTFDRAYAIIHGSVPDMPSTPPPPKPAKKYKYNIIRDAIEVTQSIGEHEWRATFDIDSFIKWVRENA